MSATWDDIIKDPEFQDLPLAGQREIRARWFDKVVAPDLKKDGIDAENLNAYRQKAVGTFNNGQSVTASTFNAVGRGFVEGGASLVEGIGDIAALVPGMEDNAFQSAGQSVKDFGDQTFPVNPANEDKFVVKAGQVIGGVVEQALEYATGAKLLGAGAQASAAAKLLAKTRINRVATGSMFGKGADGGQDMAEQYGVEDDAWKKAAFTLGGGFIEAGTEKLGGFGAESALARRFGVGGMAGGPTGVSGFTKQTLTEGGEEVAANTGNNIMANLLVTGQEAAAAGQRLPGYLQGNIEAGALGAVGGGFMSLPILGRRSAPPATELPPPAGFSPDNPGPTTPPAPDAVPPAPGIAGRASVVNPATPAARPDILTDEELAAMEAAPPAPLVANEPPPVSDNGTSAQPVIANPPVVKNPLYEDGVTDNLAALSVAVTTTDGRGASRTGYSQFVTEEAAKAFADKSRDAGAEVRVSPVLQQGVRAKEAAEAAARLNAPVLPAPVPQERIAITAAAIAASATPDVEANVLETARISASLHAQKTATTPVETPAIPPPVPAPGIPVAESQPPAPEIAPAAEVSQSAPTVVRKPKSKSRRFEADPVTYPLVTAIVEAGIAPRNPAAELARGRANRRESLTPAQQTILQRNGGYNDVPKVIEFAGRPRAQDAIRKMLRNGSQNTPDVALQQAAEFAGRDPQEFYGNTAWQEIREELMKLDDDVAAASKEDERMDAMEKQALEFYAAIGEGKFQVDVTTMEPGDSLIIEGEPVMVKKVNRDENGDIRSVELQDGTKFGRQEIDPTTALFVEEFQEDPTDATPDVQVNQATLSPEPGRGPDMPESRNLPVVPAEQAAQGEEAGTAAPTPKVTAPVQRDERVFDADYTGPRWTYGMRNRPVGLGAAPKGYIIGSGGPAQGRARNGTIQYPRELTGDELYQFEMELMEAPDPAPSPTESAPAPEVTADGQRDMFAGREDEPFNLTAESAAERRAREAKELAASTKARQQKEEAARKALEAATPELPMAEPAESPQSFSDELRASGRNPDKIPAPALDAMEAARRGDAAAFSKLTPVQKSSVTDVIIRAKDGTAADALGISRREFNRDTQESRGNPSSDQDNTQAVNDRLADRGLDDTNINVVNDSNIQWEGRLMPDGTIELNAARLPTQEDIDRVVDHEFAHLAERDPAMASDIAAMKDAMPADFIAELEDDLRATGYGEAALPSEVTANLAEALNRRFQNVPAWERFIRRIKTWAKQALGMKLNNQDALALAARIIARGMDLATSKGRSGAAADSLSLPGPSPFEAGDTMPMSALEILYSDSPILKPPAKGKVKNLSVAEQLYDAATAFWGKMLESKSLTAEQEDMITRNGLQEVLAALNNGIRNAANWYSTAIETALEVAGLLHPELMNAEAAAKVPEFARTSDPVRAARMALRMAMAITSQNLTVQLNTRYANEQFSHFLKTGRFDPSKSYGTKGASISANLKLANKLINKLGLDTAEAFIREEFTVRELKNKVKIVTGSATSITGLQNDIVNGAAIFGPKIGQGFLQNLMGIFDPVTIDLWLRRTWGRWTGNVVGDGVTEDRLAAMLDASRSFGIRLPDSLKTLIPVTRYRKNGNSYRTMSLAVIDRLEDPVNTKLRQSVIAAAEELDKRWQNDAYKLLKLPVPADFASAMDVLFGEASEASSQEEITAAEETIRQAATHTIKGSPTFKDVVRILGRKKKAADAAWEKFRAKNPKDKTPKANWLQDHYVKSGGDASISNKAISGIKPEWAKAAKVIMADLNPIDIPNNDDRRAITRVINNIRKEMEKLGYTTTNADIQALLWYPEKDIWAKMRGDPEPTEDNEGNKLNSSYDDEFIKLAESIGRGDEAIAIRQRIGEDRAARDRRDNDGRTDGSISGTAAEGSATSEAGGEVAKYSLPSARTPSLFEKFFGNDKKVTAAAKEFEARNAGRAALSTLLFDGIAPDHQPATAFEDTIATLTTEQRNALHERVLDNIFRMTGSDEDADAYARELKAHLESVPELAGQRNISMAALQYTNLVTAAGILSGVYGQTSAFSTIIQTDNDQLRFGVDASTLLRSDLGRLLGSQSGIGGRIAEFASIIAKTNQEGLKRIGLTDEQITLLGRAVANKQLTANEFEEIFAASTTSPENASMMGTALAKLQRLVDAAAAKANPPKQPESEIETLWRLMQEARGTKRGAAIAAALKAFMPDGPRNLSKANQAILADFRARMQQQGGENLARSFWQLMSNTPRPAPGSLASFDSATQSMLSDLLKRAVEKAGLAGNTTSLQPDAIQKLVLNLSNDNLRWDKIAAADEAVQAEIDAITDDAQREAVRAAWEDATSDMSFALGGPALMRRALRDQMKDTPPNWKAAFDTGKPMLEAIAYDRVTFVNAAMVKIENALTTDEALSKIPALRAEMEATFNDIAAERYAGWLQGRERIAAQQKTAAARANFMAALKNRGVAESRLDKLAEALSDTPTYNKPGEVNPVTALINAQMKQADPDFVAKMTALGVTSDVAGPLESLIEENRRRTANIDAVTGKPAKLVESILSKAVGPLVAKLPVDQIVRAMMTAPAHHRNSAAWRELQINRWLAEQGIDSALASRLTRSMDEVVAGVMANVIYQEQERYVTGKKGVGTQSISNPEFAAKYQDDPAAVREAIRKGLLDDGAPWQAWFSSVTGLPPLSQQVIADIARLESVLSGDKYQPSEKGVAAARLRDLIDEHFGKDATGWEILAASYDASALSSGTTMGIQFSSPLGRLIGTFGADLIGRAYSPGKAIDVIDSLMSSMDVYAAELPLAWKYDTAGHTMGNAEQDLSRVAVLRRDLAKYRAILANPNTSTIAWVQAIPRVLIAAQDFLRQAMNAADSAAAAGFQRYFETREVRRLMRRNNITKAQIQSEMDRNGFFRDQVELQADALGYDGPMKRRYIQDALWAREKELSRARTDSPEAHAERMAQLTKAAQQEGQFQIFIGEERDSPGVTDPVDWALGGLQQIGQAAFRNARERVDAGQTASGSLQRIAARAIFGFVGIPLNAARASIWYSPLAAISWANYLAHKSGKAYKDGNPYARSLGNEIAVRQRIKEGIVGNTIILLGIALAQGLDDDDEDKWQINGYGPDPKKYPDEAKAWQRRHVPFSVERIGKDGKAEIIPFKKGPLEFINAPLMLLGGANDARLNSKLAKEPATETRDLVMGAIRQLGLSRITTGMRNAVGIRDSLQQMGQDNRLDQFGSSAGFMVTPVMPWSGTERWIRTWNNPEMLERGFNNNLPFAHYRDDARPALNSFGQPIRPAPEITEAISRQTNGVLPGYARTLTPDDNRLYSWMERTGKKPTTYARSVLETRVQQPVSDAQWWEYTKTSGQVRYEQTLAAIDGTLPLERTIPLRGKDAKRLGPMKKGLADIDTDNKQAMTEAGEILKDIGQSAHMAGLKAIGMEEPAKEKPAKKKAPPIY